MKSISKMMMFLVILLLSVACTNNKDCLFNKKVYSGDTKFYKDGLLLSSDGALMIIDTNSDSIQKFEDAKVNWLDTLPEENLIVHSSFDNDLSITILNDSQSVIKTTLIKKDDNLRIDPTISKLDDTYFITATKILGTVNNADKNAENGIYTVELYMSKDLNNWEKVTDILSIQENIEDVDILTNDNRMYLTYEQEAYDKGPSSINVIYSDDKGMNWSKPISLVDRVADNEPASFIKSENNYILMYSSDEDNIGASYEGAKAYVNLYDKNFELVDHTLLKTSIDHNMILYDAKSIDDKWQLLYVNDYTGERSLIIDSIDISTAMK